MSTNLARTALKLAIVRAIAIAAAAGDRTYCNPLDIDYAYSPIPSANRWAAHRSTADPVVVPYRDAYFLFSTNQWGYWHSPNLLDWTFVTRRFLLPEHDVPDDLCAPAAWVQDGALHLLGSSHKPNFPIWRSSDPQRDTWTIAVQPFPLPAWDPGVFQDEDGRVYLYYGSSNVEPIRGVELDRATLQPIGVPRELLRLHDEVHGWERFGEHHDNTFLRPFIEGPWMNKCTGKYYLQYGAPGTEFSGYGDGVYVGEAPLGPFTYQKHNPFALKPGGFGRGAGHGSTFADRNGNWWHVGTIAISVKNNFERRIGIWPAGFDADGQLTCDTSYGDFPHYLPQRSRMPEERTFTGWMILNYVKPVRCSSTLGGFSANFAVDEDIRTYWSAATSGAGEWLESDLGAESTIEAIQVNYADQDATLVGKVPGLRTRFVIKASSDQQSWKTIVDRAASNADSPHAYIDLDQPITARYVRIENICVPSGKFALSGLRVFGRGSGKPPPAPEQLIALRGDSERRNAWLKWKAVPEATGYVIYAGFSPEKLYTSVTVLGATEYYFRFLNRDQPHYFAIEAFNENGISPRSTVVETP